MLVGTSVAYRRDQVPTCQDTQGRPLPPGRLSSACSLPVVAEVVEARSLQVSGGGGCCMSCGADDAPSIFKSGVQMLFAFFHILFVHISVRPLTQSSAQNVACDIAFTQRPLATFALACLLALSFKTITVAGA